MLTHSSPQPLLAQFQARYPTASLIAELLTIHQDSYVVRAVVQMGNMPIATGMAAANNIEQAEDRAKTRALAALGIESFMPEGTSIAIQSASSAFSNLPLPSTAALEEITTPPIAPPIQQPRFSADIPALDQVAPPKTPYPISDMSDMEDGEALIQSLLGDQPLDYSSDYSLPPLDPTLSNSVPSDSALSDPVETSPEPEPVAPPAPPVSKSKATKRKTEVAEAIQVDSQGNEKGKESTDRSEEIARIGVEMKRLGWTTEQGRSYLKRTYGKKSRQELSDDELLDFLRYLESQASPTSSLF